MKLTLLNFLLFAIVLEIQGFIWYKPQHIFDKVCLLFTLHVLGLKFKVVYLFRTVLTSYGRPIFHMENMKEYGNLTVSWRHYMIDGVVKILVGGVTRATFIPHTFSGTTLDKAQSISEHRELSVKKYEVIVIVGMFIPIYLYLDRVCHNFSAK